MSTFPQMQLDGSFSLNPQRWVDEHGDYLYGYALSRLRDASTAEDMVQETLLAALESYSKFAERSSERTWLVGILRHKIIDHFRQSSRQVSFDEDEAASPETEALFQQTGKWAGHWKLENAPAEWHADPATLFENKEFWETFQRCLSALPSRLAAAFTLREIDGLTSEEICQVLNISASNLWVMLHRARLHLRRSLELNWFKERSMKTGDSAQLRRKAKPSVPAAPPDKFSTISFCKDSAARTTNSVEAVMAR